MNVNLANYEKQAREAVMYFWSNRETALAKQTDSGRKDAGARGAVTTGKNMDGFCSIVHTLVKANGLAKADIYEKRPALTLPGFYRPTKLWDMLVMHLGNLVAAVEFKSQVGPSFGNNFNNRCEEAIGAAHDFWTAYHMGAFGNNAPKPILSWFMLLEDCDASNTPVKLNEQHFSVDPVFKEASYAQCYNLFCKRLVENGLYTTATLLISPQQAVDDGQYYHLCEATSLKTFATVFAKFITNSSR